MRNVYLTQCGTFTAIHAHDGQLNEPPHPHQFTYQVTFYGPINSEGFLIDFREVQAFLQTHIREKLHRKDLNTILKKPTSENIALWIFKTVQKQFAQVIRVRVAEEPDRWVEYEGENTPTTHFATPEPITEFIPCGPAQMIDLSLPKSEEPPAPEKQLPTVESTPKLQAVIGLGSNIPPAKKNIDRAVVALARLGEVKQVSPYISSKPEGFTNQPDFVNAVAILNTNLSPIALLRELKALEAKLGRVATFPQGPRIIDLDILFYDNRVLSQDDEKYPLQIPHPRLAEREFVLKPLSYLLPDYIHPQLGKPIYQLYRELMKKKGAPTCQIL